MTNLPNNDELEILEALDRLRNPRKLNGRVENKVHLLSIAGSWIIWSPLRWIQEPGMMNPRQRHEREKALAWCLERNYPAAPRKTTASQPHTDL